ncbi:RnfH family protein [Luteimonas huabeiensis]|uniref:RnfH family protein n=1 Tax=Luteimonas huabeiensis TaxID=1244513 RepID=UPI0005BD1C2C
MRVEVILAWPGRFERAVVALPVGATVAQALAASGLPMAGVDGYAVFGERVEPSAVLADGDRLELLRPLQADPKEARRRRAAARGR